MRLLAKIALELYIFEDAEFLLESCLVFDPNNIKVKHDYITTLLRRQKYGLALKTAKELKVFFNDSEDSPIVISLSLFGFTETFSRISPSTK